jgi:hypothetical protein
MSAAAGGAHEYARRVLKRPRHMNARGGSCCLGSESAYNAHAQISVMLAGDESVVEPWLLGWCWVVVRAGGGAESMPYCSVGESG